MGEIKYANTYKGTIMNDNQDLGAFAGANPTELDDITAGRLKPRTIEAVKNVYCENYNSCLDYALKKDWSNFSCTKCSSYFPINWYQRAMDQIGLYAAYEAAGYVHKHGNAHRKPGVKPGDYSNKAKKRLPVIADRAEGGTDISVLRKAVVG